jgi:hypothetical protein
MTVILIGCVGPVAVLLARRVGPRLLDTVSAP